MTAPLSREIGDKIHDANMQVVRTVRLKVKRESYGWLNAAAREVNVVWNYCNETSYLAATRTDSARKWLGGFDLINLTAGATECFGRIASGTIQSVCSRYAEKRRAAKRLKISWRSSGGSRRALGWIPFRADNIKRRGNSIRFAGKTIRIFEHARLDGVQWRDGCFAQDAVGDWWLCLPIKIAAEESVAPREAVGIDLGIKTIATASDGDELEAGRWTHLAAHRLAQAQRRGHMRQAKRIHRKAARQRLDALHKFSTRIVREYQNIVIGDVSSISLVKTRMAKAVLDSGWGMLRTQLQYKGQQAGRCVEVVNEAFTTRACSDCGALTGPQGRTGLVVREWICEDCGASHSRDVNAARNILALRYPASVSGNEQPTYKVAA